MARTVLITGGSGFLGLHLIREFQAHGDRLRVCDREPLDPELTGEVDFQLTDVRDRQAVDRLVAGCEVVIHNAASLPIARAGQQYWSVNVEGTQTVLTSALAQGVRKVIFISTSAVYGIPSHCPITEATPLTPLGQYGWSKFEAERVCQGFRDRGLDVSILRPRTLVGTGRLGIFGILFDWVRRGKRIYIIGRGDNRFQLLSARDCSRACWLATTVPCRNEEFNLGARDFGTVRADLTAFGQHAGTGARVASIPSWLAKPVLRLLDRLRLSPLVDWHYETPDKAFYFAITKARHVLGWEPQESNLAMLTTTYDWYLANRHRLERQVGVTHRKTVAQRLLKLLRTFS